MSGFSSSIFITGLWNELEIKRLYMSEGLLQYFLYFIEGWTKILVMDRQLKAISGEA
jgi:hypothetical protein